MAMKILAVGLLLVLCTFSSIAQNDSEKYKLSEPVKVISVYAGSIILNAAGNALNDARHRELGHICNAASVGLILSSPFIIDYNRSKWGWYLTSYLALRVALYDYSYNFFNGKPLNYNGSSSYWDKFMGKLNPPNFYFGRAVALTVGISIPINKFNRHALRATRPGLTLDGTGLFDSLGGMPVKAK